MKSFYSLLLLLTISLCVTNNSAAQQKFYSNFTDPTGHYNSSFTGGNPILGTPTLTNPQYIADGDTTNVALFTLPLVNIGNWSVTMGAALNLGSYNYMAPGSSAGVTLNAGGLSLNVLSGMTLYTYFKGVLQEAASGSSVLQLTTILGNKQNVSFVTTKAFDSVSITVNNGVGLALGGSTSFYYVSASGTPGTGTPVTYYSNFSTNPASHVNYSVSSVSIAGYTGLSGTMTNPSFFSDADTTNFAQYSSLVSLALLSNAPVSIWGDLNLGANTYMTAGSTAGVLFSSSSAIGLSALSNITLTTYLNGLPQESASGSSLLALAIISNGKSNVSFVTTKPFNGVGITLNGGLLNVSLGQTSNFYYASATGTTGTGSYTTYLSNFTDTTGHVGYAISSVNVLGSPVIPGTITNRGNFAGDTSLAAQYQSLAALTVGASSPISIQTDLNLGSYSYMNAGSYAGVAFANSSLLDITALSNITLTTFLDGFAQETASGSSLLTLGVLTNGKQYVSFLTSKAFNGVGITINGGLLNVSVGQTSNFYYAAAVGTPGTGSSISVGSSKGFNTPSAYVKYSISNVTVGGVPVIPGTMNNPNGFTDASGPSSYASYNSLLSLTLGSVAPISIQGTLNISPYGFVLAGGSAGVVLSTTSVLDPTSLSNITLTTYLNNAPQETATGSAVLISNLPSGQQNVSFNTTKPFNAVGISINGGLLNATVGQNTNFYNAAALGAFSGSSTLPVNLSSFTSSIKNNAIVLQWSTTLENNNSGFYIERSLDNKAFSGIGFVKSQASNGNSNSLLNYSFVDANPGDGVNYYRLRQVDISNASTYSNTISQNMSNVALKLYPNPVTSVIHITGAVANAQFIITDISGQVVKTTTDPNINVANLAPGIYFLQTVSGSEKKVIRFVKQ